MKRREEKMLSNQRRTPKSSRDVDFKRMNSHQGDANSKKFMKCKLDLELQVSW